MIRMRSGMQKGGPEEVRPFSCTCAAADAKVRPTSVGETRGCLRGKRRQRSADDSLIAFDDLPRVDLLEDLRGERGVQRVAGAVRDQVTDHRVADERQVADRIEDLVPDEL